MSTGTQARGGEGGSAPPPLPRRSPASTVGRRLWRCPSIGCVRLRSRPPSLADVVPVFNLIAPSGAPHTSFSAPHRPPLARRRRKRKRKTRRRRRRKKGEERERETTPQLYSSLHLHPLHHLTHSLSLLSSFSLRQRSHSSPSSSSSPLDSNTKKKEREPPSQKLYLSFVSFLTHHHHHHRHHQGRLSFR